MKHDLPIRRRLALIITVSIGISLLCTALFFAARQTEHRRSAKLTELRSMAEVIAFNATAVVEFQLAGAGSPAVAHRQTVLVNGSGAVADWSHVTSIVPISMNEATIGMVSLTASLGSVWREIATDLAAFAAASLVAFGLALLIANRMQRSLLSALGSLTDTANRVAGSKNFSERATKHSNDEIGQLADARRNCQP